MLIITCCIGEFFIVNDDVSITVLDIKDSQVHLGIKPPANVGRYLLEIYKHIQNESFEWGIEDEGSNNI